MHVPLKVVGVSTLVVIVILVVPVSFVSMIVKFIAIGAFLLCFVYLLLDKYRKKKEFYI